MCKYCEGNNIEREDIGFTENCDAVCIWDNKLLIDDGETNIFKINYCPMCGRKLRNGSKEVE